MPSLDDFDQTEKLAAVIKQRDQALKRLQKEKQRTQDLVDAVMGAAEVAASGVTIVPKPKIKHSKGKEQVALFHLTDWQIGKQTATYNSEVGQQRVQDFWVPALTLIQQHRSAVPVKKAVIMLGGDMVEGVGIFPGQAYEVDQYLFDQLFQVAAMIRHCVEVALENFEEVWVYEEWGNHGRLGRRGEMPGMDNVDRMAYRIAQDQLQHDRLTWVTHDSFGNHVQIGEYTALLVHGDEIRGFGGNLPQYGIMKKCNGWAAGAYDHPFRDVYMGHYHQVLTMTMASGGQIYVTGSPESDNMYAKEFVAATGVPSQRLHMIDPYRGRVVSEHIIWLD